MATALIHWKNLLLLALSWRPDLRPQVCYRVTALLELKRDDSLLDERTTLKTLHFGIEVLQLQPCISNSPHNSVKRAWGGSKEAERLLGQKLEEDSSHSIILMTDQWPIKSLF